MHSSPARGGRPCALLSRAYDHRELTTVVDSARAGEESAWTTIVERFDPMVRKVVQGYRLSPAEIDDVAQSTWLMAFTEIDRLRRPAAIGAWLATAARRIALALHQTRVREYLTDDNSVFEGTADSDPEAEMLAANRRDVLHRALATLSGRQRELIMLLAGEDLPDYRAISSALGMPVGSIGPTRARSLERLSRNQELRELRD